MTFMKQQRKEMLRVLGTLLIILMFHQKREIQDNGLLFTGQLKTVIFLSSLFLINECEVNVDSVYGLYHTPLHNAAYNGRLDIVMFLVEKGHANVEAKCDNGITPLYWAVEQSKIDVVKYLVDKCDAKITYNIINAAR